MSSGNSKVWWCKQQYCIETCNVRSKNQGKLCVVKQELARVNINIFWVSGLKWTRMGEINSDDHYIYYCGQESLRRNRVALIVNKRVWNPLFECSFKNNRMISIHFQANHWRSQKSKSVRRTLMPEKLKLNSSMVTYKTFENYHKKKSMSFFIKGDWNAKLGSQEILEITGKFGLEVQNEVGQRITFRTHWK